MPFELETTSSIVSAGILPPSPRLRPFGSGLARSIPPLSVSIPVPSLLRHLDSSFQSLLRPQLR